MFIDTNNYNTQYWNKKYKKLKNYSFFKLKTNNFFSKNFK